MRLAIFLAFLAVPLLASTPVALSRASFNPYLHETITYAVTITEPGTLTARILDRDTYLTKTLANAQRVTPGTVALTWDGTDDKGTSVADEAWSLQLEFHGKHSWTYFPASAMPEMAPIRFDSYDEQTGVLRYTLPVASRVHIQAGVADRRSASKTAGAVMKTLVNRAPRPAGAVIEQWMGMDESKTIYVPALPNFVVAVAATPLPENSVITYGNRNTDFLKTALTRAGAPLLEHHGGHAHHQGLSALDDITPRLDATPDARWHASDKTWISPSRRVRFALNLAGPNASRFARQPARLVVYLDQQRVVDKPADTAPLTIDLPTNDVPHIVAINWVSAYGPVAATAFRIARTR